jgi:hypothetical protein
MGYAERPGALCKIPRQPPAAVAAISPPNAPVRLTGSAEPGPDIPALAQADRVTKAASSAQNAGKSETWTVIC